MNTGTTSRTVAGSGIRGGTGTGTSAAATGTGQAPGRADAPAAGWPQGPHAAGLISFNLQPSRWLHASRWAALLPPGWAAPVDGDAARHRLCSALILRQLGDAAAPVTDWARPEWPLALLPPPVWSRLLLRLGLLPLQQALRRAIRGDELRAWAAAVGEAELDWARRAPPPALPDVVDPLPPPAQASLRVGQLGATLLAQASAAAPAGLRVRLALRAPAIAPPPPDLGATRRAWAQVQTLIDELEPTWRSSFPASR